MELRRKGNVGRIERGVEGINERYGVKMDVGFNCKMVRGIKGGDFFGKKEDDKEVDDVC